MNETNNAVRKTVYLDEELTKRCEILFGEADVSSFSQFVTKALETYIDRLICENPARLSRKNYQKQFKTRFVLSHHVCQKDCTVML